MGAIPFVLTLWDFALRPLRTAEAHGFASDFYDVQARALFHGHLALPDRVLGIESFIRDGQTYMYFPPFPALLRMPVLLVTARFDGRLTALSMLLAWAVLAVSTVLLVWRVRRLVRGSAPVSRTDAVASGILIATITGGSVLLYIASLPWVYHEVYLWSAAFTIAACAALVALAAPGAAPRQRQIVVLGFCLLGVILTRATAGWPMALSSVGFGGWLAMRRVDRFRRHGLLIVVAGAIPLLVSAVINWLKFRHPYMIPLEDQLWTQVSARRRLALMVNDGSLAGPQFLPTTLANYFRLDGIRFVPTFPFVTLPAEPARSYNGAFLDQTYRTGSVPSFMPLLFLLSLWGFAIAFRRRVGRALSALRIPMLGALGVTATVMCYGYIGFRYTTEFVAALTIGSAVGLADVTQQLAGRSRRAKQVGLATIGLLAVFGVYANTAVAITAARASARGVALEQFVTWQDRVSSVTGNPLADVTHSVDELPASAPPDHLYIVGDCAALYLSTGEVYEPWLTVEMREMSVVVKTSDDGFRSALMPLLRVDGERPRQITLESNDRSQVRLRVGEGFYFFPSRWQTITPGEAITLSLVADSAKSSLRLTFGEWESNVALAEWDSNWHVVLTHPAFRLAPLEAQLRAGVGLTPELGPPLELCNRLLDRVDS